MHHFRHFRREFSEAIFCAQARYLNNIVNDLEHGLLDQIEPKAHREPKDAKLAREGPFEGVCPGDNITL